MRRFKKNKISIIILVLLVVSVGYALVSTQLGINGTFNVARTTFDVHWANPAVTSGSVSNTLPNIGQDSGAPANTKLSWSATFNVPGDFYEFTVDAENSGTIDAMITGINMKVNNTDINANPSPLPEYITYELIYANGDPVVEGKVLKADDSNYNPRIKYKVRVEYDAEKATAATVNAIPNNGVTYNFNLILTYAKADKENATVVYACPGPKCVYAYFTTEKQYTLYLNYSPEVLSDYTYDYKSLNKNRFLGFVLDDDGVMQRGFACGIENDGRVFCIEGHSSGYDEDSDEKNRKVLKDVYNSIDPGCTVGNIANCNGNVNAHTDRDSNKVFVCDRYNTEKCCLTTYGGTAYCID